MSKLKTLVIPNSYGEPMLELADIGPGCVRFTIYNRHPIGERIAGNPLVAIAGIAGSEVERVRDWLVTAARRGTSFNPGPGPRGSDTPPPQ